MTPAYEQFLAETVAKLQSITRPTEDCLDRVLASDRLLRSGTWIEFGTASGASLRRMIAKKGDAHVWGADSFTGLPEAWHIEPKGAFAQGHPPSVVGANLLVGYFQETLPGFSPPLPVTLAHVDCDVYSGASPALSWLWPRLVSGSIVTFDEIWGYPTYAEHEMLALYEVRAAPVRTYEWIFASLAQASLIIL